MSDIKLGNNDITFKVGSGDCSIYLGDTLLYPQGQPPTPTLQWVTFRNGDTIPSDLDIYGVSGVANDLCNTFGGDFNNPLSFTPNRNKTDIVVACGGQSCYSDSPLSTSTVSLIFSDIGCCDYVNQGATVGGDINLYIYA